MDIEIHIDGGSRGNPGPAGAGVVIRDASGKRVFEGAFFIGSATNNVAEYHGLLRGIERALAIKPDNCSIFSDSELLVRQITGEYRVKSPGLQALHEQAQIQLLRLGRWSIRHVRREQNTRADELANMAMDERRDVVVFDAAQEKAVGSGRPARERKTEKPEKGGESHARTLSGGEDTQSESPRPIGVRRILVGVAAPPKAESCPAGKWCERDFTIDACVPAQTCVFAAHALLPTILAIHSTDAAEAGSFPTMTVRCGRPGCSASFRVSPEPPGNGAAH